MAGRRAGYRHIDETRAKIKATQLINRLQKHIDAESPILDASQVNAAKALLNKVLPDLKAVDVTGSLEHEAGSSIQHLMQRIDGRTRSK